MQYFAWGINKPNVKDQRTALLKSHWKFIATYEEYLIARGPVIDSNDLSVVVGSIHIIDLPGFAEAKEFVNNEPFAKAGIFETIILCRFVLELGRAQFEFVSKPDSQRFFIYCPASQIDGNKTPELKKAHEDYCNIFDTAFICRGSLVSRKGEWKGQVYFVEFPDKSDVDTFFSDEPYAVSNLYDRIEISRWTMGGPENLNAIGALS